MVVKKKVKKVIGKSAKKVSKKTIKKVVSKPKKLVRFGKKKFHLVLKNLILFAILFILSLVIYNVSNNEIYSDLFFLLSMIFGFVAVAFLIILLVFLFMRVMKK